MVACAKIQRLVVHTIKLPDFSVDGEVRDVMVSRTCKRISFLLGCRLSYGWGLLFGLCWRHDFLLCVERSRLLGCNLLLSHDSGFCDPSTCLVSGRGSGA